MYDIPEAWVAPSGSTQRCQRSRNGQTAIVIRDGPWRLATATMSDTDGRALVPRLQPASVQGRDGAIRLLKAPWAGFPFIEVAFADTSPPIRRGLRCVGAAG
jgi:hypothetical protein